MIKADSSKQIIEWIIDVTIIILCSDHMSSVGELPQKEQKQLSREESNVLESQQ